MRGARRIKAYSLGFGKAVVSGALDSGAMLRRVTATQSGMIAKRLALVVALAFGVLWAPLVAKAQQAAKVYRLGILSPAAVAPGDAAQGAFPRALRELGYIEGQNLLVERRFAEGKIDRLPRLARELVQLRVDVIFAVSQAAVQAARDVTSSLPIVIMASADPVGQAGLPALPGLVGTSPE